MCSKVSIIVAAYNVDQFLNACLLSIQKQSYQNIEVLVINDCSNDRTSEIAHLFSGTDHRFVTIDKVLNEGLSAARNTGIDLSTGDYIVFIDGDDFLSPFMIETLVKKIGSSDLCICDYFDYYENISDFAFHDRIKRDVVLARDEFLNTSLPGVCSVVAWNKLYKRELFNGIRYPNGRIHEDEFCFHHIVWKCESISVIHDRLYYYRHRSGSITKRPFDIKKLDANWAFLDRFAFYSSKKNWKLASDAACMCERLGVKAWEQISANKDIQVAFKTWNNEFRSALSKNLFHIKWHAFCLGISYLFSLRAYKFFIKVENLLKSFARSVKHPLLWWLKILIKVKICFFGNGSVLFIGTPLHGNLGDQAIAISSLSFLHKKYGKKHVIEIPGSFYLSFRSILKTKDPRIIYLHGGGNLGNQYLSEELLRRMVIHDFPNTKTAVFPQTVFFTSDEDGKTELHLSSLFYSESKRLVLFVRERFSLVTARTYFPSCDIRLCPDMALRLEPFKSKATREDKCLAVLRNDVEKAMPDQFSNEMLDSISKSGSAVERIDTNLPIRITPINREKILKRFLRHYTNSKFVVTDRLHGMVFGYLTSTPTIAFGNYNFKVEGIFEWIKPSGFIFFKNYDNISDFDKYLISFKGTLDTLVFEHLGFDYSVLETFD